ncbi:MAG: hypothetical protein ABIH68_07905, partial [bacterium]
IRRFYSFHCGAGCKICCFKENTIEEIRNVMVRPSAMEMTLSSGDAHVCGSHATAHLRLRQSCGHIAKLLGLTAPSGTIRRLVVAHTAPSGNGHFCAKVKEEVRCFGIILKF